MIADCYLQAEGDQRNYIYFDERNLVIRYRDSIHRIYLRTPTRLAITHKKYILPIILGGILSAFSLLMIWHNLFSPWPVLITFLASLTAFYFGWQGSWMLIMRQSGQELTFPITESHTHLERFTKFFNDYQKGKIMKSIYHITTEENWSKQKENITYSDLSLQTEGFIHCSEAQQIPGVLKRFFMGVENLVLLEIDALKLNKPLKYEGAEDIDDRFPHIYGPINHEAITKIIKLEKAENFTKNLLGG